MVKLSKLNRFLFLIYSLVLLIYVYFVMTFSAFEEEAGNSSIFTHIFRFLLEILGLIVLFVNRFNLLGIKKGRYVIIWIIWIIVCSIVVPDRYFINLTIALLWPIIYLSYFIFSRDEIIRYKYLPRFIFILCAFSSIYYVYVLLFMNTDIIGRLASVSHVYYVLLLLPWVLTFKSKSIKNILLFFFLILAIFSAKRAAILITLFVVLLYFFIEYITLTSVKNKVVGVLFFVVGIVAMIFTFDYLNDLNDGYLLSRLENIQNDKGSGRLDIYAEVIEEFSRSPIENLFFGNGHNTVRENISYRLSAHNDYLEILFDYGAVGLVLFLLIVVSLFKRYVIIRKYNSEYLASYVSFLVIFLFMTLVSHIVLYPTYIIFLFSYLGMIDLELSKKEKI